MAIKQSDDITMAESVARPGGAATESCLGASPHKRLYSHAHNVLIKWVVREEWVRRGIPPSGPLP